MFNQRKISEIPKNQGRESDTAQGDSKLQKDFAASHMGMASQSGMKNRNFDWPAFREFTFGTGGSGKTTALLARLKKQRAKYFFVFDHKHEFGTRLDKPYVYSLEELTVATARGGWIIFDPCVMFPGDKETAFQFFCDFVYDVAGHLKGRKIFICDELQMFMSASNVPRELMLVLDDGRNFCLDTMAICQAGNSVHNRVRNQITEAFTFRQSDENAVKFLTQNGYQESEIRSLQPGEFIWRNFNTGETRRGGKAFRIESQGARGV